MLKTITLRNYKSFKYETTIDVKPLTLLCGVNSSGKSSIMKSLLMIKQSFQNRNPRGEVTYNEKYVNNGDFKSIAFSNSDSVCIANEFVIKSDSVNDRDTYKELYRIIFGENVKTKELKRLCEYKKNPFVLNFRKEIKNKRIINYKISLIHSGLINPINVLFYLDRDNTYHVTVKNLKLHNYSTTDQLINCKSTNTVCYFEGITITNLYANNPPKDIDIQPVFNFITLLLKNISTQYQNSIEHIAPLRTSPSRLYVSDSSYSTVGISGENAIQLLNEVSEETAYNILAPTYDVFKTNYSKYRIEDVVNSWLEYMDLGRYRIKKSDGEIIRFYIEKQSIADVGFGVSQILPIIVEGCIMKQYQTLLLEQPEIHLHPKAQMKIADYLLSLALCKKNIIVETHSDHVINRLVRRCLENPKLIDLISILFLNKDDEGVTRINPIHIDQHMGIDKAPADFFDQYAAETDMIIQKGYENMLRDLRNKENND